MLATETPFPQYFGLNGDPLDDGYLYFGAVGQNPEASPVTVYWDSAGTQPAAQPIRTKNGYTVRAGTPAVVYASADYSLAVRDRRKRLVFYAQNSAEFSNSASTNASLTAFISSLAASAGSALVGFIQAAAGAIARTLQDKGREIVTPLDFMTPAQRADVLAGTALIDVSNAFNLAAAASRHVRVPGYVYLVDNQVDILDEQTWEFQGAELKHSDETKHILRANGRVGWSIVGRLTLRGTLASASTAAETGLYVTGGKKFKVEGVIARNFKGKGFWFDGATTTGIRGDRGQLTDCAAYDCTVGRQVDAGAGAEYHLWTNFSAGGCVTGDQMSAGNNVTVGGNIVDNTIGVRLLSGTNHGHGMYVGVNINHNPSANIWATGVTNGYTFTGCHAYGNGTSTGPIWFEGCKGMQFLDGAIDCWIYNDSGAGSGANFVAGNYFPGDYGVSLLSNNGALGQLYLRDNMAPTGPSAVNDAAPVAALVYRGTNQSMTAGAAVKVAWDTESIDNRGIHSGGDFTIPTPGTQLYEISSDIYLTAASGIASGGVVEVKVNGTAKATWPLTALNATNGSVGGDSTLLPLANGDIVTIWVTANTGAVSPSLLASQSRMSVMLRA
jgi:hypothetical protein